MTVEQYFAAQGQERESFLGSLSAPELLRLGVELYNQGHFWNAHEAWEEVWLEAPNQERAFYQGLIQITAAFVHVTRNEYPGAVRLLRGGIAKLEAFRPLHLGVDVAALLDGARASLRRLLELGESGVRDFDRGLIPAIEFRLDAP